MTHKAIFAILFILFCTNMVSQCAEILSFPPLLEEKFNISKQLILNAQQKDTMRSIAENEKNDIRPMALSLYVKEDRMHELLLEKCSFDIKCVKKRKENIETLKADIYETKRQIDIKKAYYTILYKNILTRDQGLLLNELLKAKP